METDMATWGGVLFAVYLFRTLYRLELPTNEKRINWKRALLWD